MKCFLILYLFGICTAVPVQTDGSTEDPPTEANDPEPTYAPPEGWGYWCELVSRAFGWDLDQCNNQFEVLSRKSQAAITTVNNFYGKGKKKCKGFPNSCDCSGSSGGDDSDSGGCSFSESDESSFSESDDPGSSENGCSSESEDCYSSESSSSSESRCSSSSADSCSVSGCCK